MPPIELTWNLFVTVAAIPALGWYLGYMILRNDKSNEDRHKAIVKLFDENREDHSKIFQSVNDHERRIAFIEGKTNGAGKRAAQ